MKIGFLEQAPGVKSTMRLLAVWGAAVGTLITVFAIGFAFFAATRGATGPMFIAGPGLFGAGQWAKSFQARGEKSE